MYKVCLFKGSERSTLGIPAGDNVTCWIPAAMPHMYVLVLQSWFKALEAALDFNFS